MAIEAIVSADFEEKILHEEAGILLDFWRENCGACQSLSKELAQVSEERPELKVYSANVDTETELVNKFRVMMAPTLLFIKGGAVKKRSIGFKSKKSIMEMADDYFNLSKE